MTNETEIASIALTNVRGRVNVLQLKSDDRVAAKLRRAEILAGLALDEIDEVVALVSRETGGRHD